MSTTPPSSFDDPALKGAVRRVWGGEVAPAALRERVQAMGIGAARAPASDVALRPARPRRAWTWPLRYPRPVYGLAAVVTMVIGFAIAYRLDQPPAWRNASPAMTASNELTPATTLPAVMPVPTAERLLQVHARCSTHEDHNAFKTVARGDFDTLRQRLEKELGFPVLVGPINGQAGEGAGEAAGEGWEFRGGAVCAVGGVPAAHLVFARRNQVLSVFSLPRSACPEARGGEVSEDPHPDHPLTVFVRPQVVHCLVGSSADNSLTPDRLRAIRDRLRPYLPN